MKTCIVLEINNNKATVLFPDGEIKEVASKSDWMVGQTVPARQVEKRMRPTFIAVACIFFAFVVITPFAVNMGGFGNGQLVSDVEVNPSIKSAKVEVADSDFGNVKSYIDEFYGDVVAGSEADFAVPEDPIVGSSVDNQNKQDFSDTNIQVEGVSESDIIKSDGNYIYALNSKNLVILDTNDGNPKVISKINQTQNDNENVDQYFEMYLEKDKLVVLKTISKTERDTTNDKTQVDIYNISNPKNPTLINSLSQSGIYNSSRMIDGYLYLLSRQDSKNLDVKKDDPSTYLPEYYSGDKKKQVSPNDIVVCPENSGTTYTVISGVDVNSPTDFTHTKSILGSSDTIYVSKSNIYIANYTYGFKDVESSNNKTSNTADYTQLFKVPFDKGLFGKVISVEVPGVIENQFNMDEKDGVLRFISLVSWYIDPLDDGSNNQDSEPFEDGQYTALYTLDSNLKELGKITGIAVDEDLHASRFMGDYAYFVTFRNVDPLFSADLKDPKNPKIIGELKIPGFSDYLHPYDDGLLLGLGYDANEEDEEIGNIKLSMFDNSDPTDLSEKHSKILEGYDYTEASNNHKAILVDSDKKLVAFPSDGTYLVYSYNDKSGFKLIKTVEYYDDSYGYNYGDYTKENIIRGLFIDNVFYVITPNDVKTFDMENGFKSMSDLKINDDADPVNPPSSFYGDIIVF